MDVLLYITFEDAAGEPSRYFGPIDSIPTTSASGPSTFITVIPNGSRLSIKQTLQRMGRSGCRLPLGFSIFWLLLPSLSFCRFMSPPVFIALLLLFAVSGCRRENISLSSSSPDGAYRVEMVEYVGRLDRNFYLRLHRMADKSVSTLFESPDEGRPVGIERIVWSRDSWQFVLLGCHFFVTDTAQLTNGEAAYLLYDVKSGKLRCNAVQQSQYPKFSREDLKGIDWNGDERTTMRL
jgi:hypothetical protein